MPKPVAVGSRSEQDGASEKGEAHSKLQTERNTMTTWKAFVRKTIRQQRAVEMLEIMGRHLEKHPQDDTPNANRFIALQKIIADGGDVSEKSLRFIQDYVYEKVK